MKFRAAAFILAAALLSALLSGCSQKPEYAPRVTRTEVLSPAADGTESYTSGEFTIDASNSSDGYIMVRADSDAVLKVQILGPDGVPYTYDLECGDYRTFPLSAGSGSYKITILESVSGDFYAIKMGQEINASINDEFSPFLYPNQYVWYTAENEAVALARQISEESENDINFLANVYHYVIDNIAYDTVKAENITQLSPPDIDETLSTGVGICVDYASLMAAMLRSQGIPARLVFGYSGVQYHAWINVYIPEIGWIDRVIEFDGTEWSLMDPTLAAANPSSFVKKYTGDGTNYTVKYWY